MPKHNITHSRAFPLNWGGLRDAFRYWVSAEVRTNIELATFTKPWTVTPWCSKDGLRHHGIPDDEGLHRGSTVIFLRAISPLEFKKRRKENL